MSFKQFPQNFTGRNNKAYLCERKENLIDLFQCKYKRVELQRNVDGSKKHIDDPKNANSYQFFLNLKPNSPRKGDGPLDDNRLFLPDNQRFYCVDIDDKTMSIDELPFFMQEYGIISISTSNKIHWIFKCDDDIRPLLGNKCIQLFKKDGTRVFDIDLKDTIYETIDANIYFCNSQKQVSVPKYKIEQIHIGTPTQIEKQCDEIRTFEPVRSDMLAVWKKLMWLCVSQNQHYDTWSRMCFIMPEGKDYADLFVEWSAVDYRSCERECRSKFETSEHLQAPIGYYSLLKLCKTIDAVQTNDISEDVIIESKRSFISITHYSCARMFYNINRNAFRYTTTSGWYAFDKDGKFELTDDLIHVLIINTLKPKLVALMNEAIEDADEDDRAKLRKKISSAIEKIENTYFINGIITQLEGMYKSKEIFEPNPQCVDKHALNLFTGYHASNIVPSKTQLLPEAITPYIEHIKYICNGDGKYLLDWLAHIIQFPWIKTQVCVGVIGKQGIGKDTIYEIGRAILGHKYCMKTSRIEDDIFGRFNNNLKAKFLICLAETRALDTSKHMSLFKGLIDGSTDTIEKKGKDTLELNSYINYFISSNDVNPIKLELGDRRFCMIESKALPKPKEYYDSLYKGLKDDQIVLALYKFFMERDISNFDLKRDRVQSEYLQDLKEYSVPTTIAFLQNLLLDDKLLDSQNRISNDDLFAVFGDYLVKCNIMDSKTTKMSFSLAMNRVAEEYGLEKFRSTKTRGYTVDKGRLASALTRAGIRLD